jgi:signal transduction histidine kinase
VKFVNRSQRDKVCVDEILISRILLNLLTNAIKYSPEGGNVMLELSDQPNAAIQLCVIDEGIGISQDALPNIFDTFYRAQGVETITGTGLGLSIVKDCVERHHGTITVESEKGKGTTFTVTLPTT